LTEKGEILYKGNGVNCYSFAIGRIPSLNTNEFPVPGGFEMEQIRPDILKYFIQKLDNTNELSKYILKESNILLFQKLKNIATLNDIKISLSEIEQQNFLEDLPQVLSISLDPKNFHKPFIDKRNIKNLRIFFIGLNS